MQDTSLDAYYSIEDLGEKQRKVYEAIQKIQPCTDREICRHLGIEINRVTGRRNELCTMGLVKEYDKVKNEFGRMAIRWHSITLLH